MIKINLTSKLQKLNLKKEDFEKGYIRAVLYYSRVKSKYKTQKNSNLANMSKFESFIETQIFPNYINIIPTSDTIELKTIKTLLVASPSDLLTIKNQSFININDSFKESFSYENRREAIADYIKALGFKTCFYCNRNWISDVNNKGTYTLDHFFDKATYRCMSLSLYNLIPSCYVCNSLLKKSNHPGDISPYDFKFDFHENNKFKPSNNNIPEITLTNKKYSKYFNCFSINSMYKTHSDTVTEIHDRFEAYPESLVSSFTGVNTEDFYKSLFGKEMFEPQLDKYPLTKLTQDIGAHYKIIDEYRNILIK